MEALGPQVRVGAGEMAGRPCAHAGCGCAVEPWETFCSVECREAGPSGEGAPGVDTTTEGEIPGAGYTTCVCGHVDCWAVSEEASESPVLRSPGGPRGPDDPDEEADEDRDSWI